MKTLRGTALVVAISTLSLTLVGCSGLDTTQEAKSPSTSVESQTESSKNAGGEEAPVQGADLATAVFAVTWKDAIDIAKEKFDGDLTEVELDWNRDRFVYEVELLSATEEHDVRIDAMTGEIVNERTQALDATRVASMQAEIIDLNAVISWEEALAAALDAQNGSVVEWRLEGTQNGPQFGFDVIDTSGTDFEVTIDALTAAVISVED